jgi:hypothetical protein
MIFADQSQHRAQSFKSSCLQSGNVVLEEEGALSFLVLFAVTDAVLPDQVQMPASMRAPAKLRPPRT